MNNDFFYQYKKQIIYGVGVFFVFIILWAIITFAMRSGKVATVISVVPSSSQITINGEKTSNGTKYLKPGTYKISVSKDGFETNNQTAIITSEKDQNVIAASLLPQSDEAKKWANEHGDDYTKNEIYGSIQANSNGKFFASKNPITEKLPFEDPYFNIGYVANTDQSIKLTISTPSPRYRFFAIEQIRKWGYDPTDFTIEFRDFKNPLAPKQEVKNETK